MLTKVNGHLKKWFSEGQRLEFLEEILFFALLCVNSFYYVIKFFPLQTEFDIYDEGFYITFRGIYSNFLRSIDLGPLYHQWYVFLQWFNPDPIKIYLFTSVFLPATIGPLFYLFLRRFSYSRNQALLATLLLLFYPPLVTVDRYVHHFFAFMFFVLMLGVSFFRSERWRWFGYCSVYFIITFIRPDTAASFAVIVLGYAFYSLVILKPLRIFSLVTSGTLFGLVLLQIFCFQTIGSEGAVRELKSLGSFYDFNGRRHQLLNPQEKWDVKAVYGGAKTLTEAFSNNPKEFMAHITDATFKLFRQMVDVCLSYRIQSYSIWLILGLLLVIHFFRNSKWKYKNLRQKGLSLLAIYLFFHAIIISSIFFGSENRYLLGFILLLVSSIALLLPEESKSVGVTFVIAALLVQCLTPVSINVKTEDAHYFTDSGGSLPGACNFWLEALSSVRKIQVDSGFTSLKVWSRGSIADFLNLKNQEIYSDFGDPRGPEFPKGEISMIRKNPADYFDIAIRDDCPYWLGLFPKIQVDFIEDFYSKAEAYGFHRVATACARGDVFVSDRLFKASLRSPARH